MSRGLSFEDSYSKKAAFILQSETTLDPREKNAEKQQRESF